MLGCFRRTVLDDQILTITSDNHSINTITLLQLLGNLAMKYQLLLDWLFTDGTGSLFVGILSICNNVPE